MIVLHISFEIEFEEYEYKNQVIEREICDKITPV